MIDFCVLGSGISGSTIANLLSKKYTTHIIDKAKGIGGRSANKKIDKNKSFDHGLQYFSSDDKNFKRLLIQLVKKRILKYWNGKHLDFNLIHQKNSKKIIGKKANNDLAKYFSQNVKRSLNTEITDIKFKKSYWEIYSKSNLFLSKNLILTFPYLQTKKIAKKYLSRKFLNSKVNMIPNLTLLIEGKYSEKLLSSLKFNNEIISWAANENSKKRFNGAKTLWTIQATELFSRKYINSYKKKKKYVSNLILDEFCKISGYNFNSFNIIKLHGWKYSYNKSKLNFNCYWDKRFKIGICGDWFLGPKADSAWKSASKLFSKIKKNPPSNRRV